VALFYKQNILFFYHLEVKTEWQHTSSSQIIAGLLYFAPAKYAVKVLQ
jgi:hypothetical protein